MYNKVRDIADITAKLQELVPDATVAFAHGQMKELSLSASCTVSSMVK